MTPPDRFFRDLLRGSAPLLVWALHFFGVYVLVAAGCCGSFEASLRPTLLLASALAIAAIALLLVRRHIAAGGVLRAARVGSGVLALVGVLWTTLPMFWLPLCRCLPA